MNIDHGVAISHVARKLVGIIYAVSARCQAYDPAKICAQPALLPLACLTCVNFPFLEFSPFSPPLLPNTHHHLGNRA
jgi:hypothetical protein